MTKKDKKRNNISRIYGPRPMAFHLSAAAKFFAEQNGTSFSAQAYDRFWEEPKEQPLFCSMEKMLRGIRKYQLYENESLMQPLPVIQQIGETRLFYCKAEEPFEPNKPALFIIPSMINDSTILDLLPARSLVRWIAAQGIDTYLIDWGALTSDESLGSFDKIVEKKLMPLFEFLQNKHPAQLHAMGYCMGGVLLTALAQLSRKKCRSLIFVATPWDFHDTAPSLSHSIREWVPDVLPVLMHSNYMPVDWLNTVFASIDPSLGARKFSAFADMQQGSEAEKLFVHVERWLNSGSDLPSSVAVSCIRDWYKENKPFKKKWKLLGQTIDPGVIEEPALILISKKDKIVPPKSALALFNQLPNATLSEADCGHIGMMVGEHAKDLMWNHVKEWIVSHVQRSA